MLGSVQCFDAAYLHLLGQAHATYLHPARQATSAGCGTACSAWTPPTLSPPPPIAQRACGVCAHTAWICLGNQGAPCVREAHLTSAAQRSSRVM